jgi:hypothetical protein
MYFLTNGHGKCHLTKIHNYLATPPFYLVTSINSTKERKIRAVSRMVKKAIRYLYI